jgi:hypothetical protein
MVGVVDLDAQPAVVFLGHRIVPVAGIPVPRGPFRVVIRTVRLKPDVMDVDWRGCADQILEQELRRDSESVMVVGRMPLRFVRGRSPRLA